MNTEIVFEKARISAIEIKPASSGMSSRVKFVALATAKIARALGARWLLDKDALVKQGFTSVELDYALKDVRIKHAIERVATLEIASELATKFKVFRKGDDQKKSKKLMVSFTVNYTGALFELLEHVGKVGSAEGLCTLIVLQAEMFPAQPAAQDVDRKRSKTREKRKRSNGSLEALTASEVAAVIHAE